MIQTLFRLTAFFILILIFTSCQTDMEEVKTFSPEDNRPMLSAESFVSHYTKNAKLEAKLTARTVNYYNTEEPYYEFPNGISLVFYDKDGKLNSSLRADSAVFYDEKEFGRADGNVVITNTDGSILRSDQLYIDRKNEKIYSDKYVKINEANGYEITGKKGFESNLNFTVYTFRKTEGIIPIEEDFMEAGEKNQK